MIKISRAVLFRRFLVISLSIVFLLTQASCSRPESTPTITPATKMHAVDEPELVTNDTPVTSKEITAVWNKTGDLVVARCSPGMEAANGKIYIVGGWNFSEGLSILQAVEEFDPATGMLTRKSDIPTGRNNFGIANLDGCLYTVGGSVKNPDSEAMKPFVPSSIVEVYDPEKDKWAEVANLHGVASYAGAAAIGSKVYAFYESGGSTIVEEYDMEENAWTVKAGKTVARFGFCTVVSGGYVYLVGGTDSGGYSASKRVDRYDPATDEWTNMPDLTEARAEHTAAVVEGKIYIIGGWAVTGTQATEMLVYDPSTGECLKVASGPEAGKNFQASIGVDGGIYVAGGMIESVESAMYSCFPKDE